ncbi:PepSY-associated TM helix domain-containing protein [Uliginosibacterium sp. 31-12]|uniref:PepSY-associated TM helix domain-containing protein n=1 Tax=Uliginosibacterium sp. 31-12 TaxID=3062781 RepID=UPI0026E207BA|nr:PepSY-associated TM helix domain-containing protein [Uliginosibacterium sp. 31-12]MDO6387844.1 PepSY-associated TM helix domain-containing protein [Uliginosibacterium sp. 31-12]
MNARSEFLDQQAPTASSEIKAASRRAAWLKVLMQWHWISSAVSLIGMLFFAASGITLNNADVFESASAKVTRHAAVLPPALLAELNAQPGAAGDPPPAALKRWLSENWQLAIYPKASEWSADEVFIDLKSPGVEAWLSVDRHSGAIQYEASDRGWVAYFNDLHKGKNAGRVWGSFITVFGVACVIFSITGLLILQVHARSRWKVWPLTCLGLVIPLLLMLLCVH